MELTVAYKGKIEYGQALAIQEDLNLRRQKEEIQDTLILLEHHPVITLGRNGKTEDILIPESKLRKLNIEVRKIGRGGNATYHGPGQLVAYPIIHLYHKQRSLRDFVNKLEQSVIDFLAGEFGIQTDRHPKYRGVWLGENKIAALGIEIRHGVTMHGLAINIQPDLRPFSWIIPCGIKEKGVCSVKEKTGQTYDMAKLAGIFPYYFINVFGYAKRQ